MNTKEYGQIIERKFTFECAKLNIPVCQPIGDTLPYDFIIELDNKLLKVQCKSLRKIKTGYIAETHRKSDHRRNTKVSYEGLIDYLFLYNVEDDVFAFIHIKDCVTTTTFGPKSRNLKDYSEIAQSGRAAGSYPEGHQFKSDSSQPLLGD